MNGNFQNNYSNGWNDINQRQFNYNYQQAPMRHADNMRLTHQMPMPYVNNMQLPHQTLMPYVDNRQLPQQTPTPFVDNRQLPLQTPAQSVDNRQLPHHTPAKYADNRQFPHHTPAQSVDNRQLTHQPPVTYVDNRQFPPQPLAQHADNRQLPHQPQAPYADSRQLPHQVPAQYAGNIQLPHQPPVPYVDNRQFPPQLLAQHADNRPLPHQPQAPYADSRQLPHQMLAQYADNTQLPHQPPVPYIDNRQLPPQPPAQHADNRPLPHQPSAPYADSRQLPHQMPAQYADNTQLPHQPPVPYIDNRQLPPQPPAQQADNRPLPHQPSAPYADSRQLPHQIPVHYADNRYLQHQAPAHYADNRPLPHEMPAPSYADYRPLLHQMPAPYADNRHLRHHTPEDCVDKMCLPQQTQENFADKSPVPPQNPEDFADNKCLPHQTLEHHADKCHLPMLEHYADESQLPQKAPEDYADKQCLPPPIHCKICNCVIGNNLERHNNGRRHRKKISELPQNPEDFADNKCLPHQTLEHHADKCHLPMLEHYADESQLPQKAPEDYADKQCLPPPVHCKICNCVIGNKCLETHNNGRRHRKKLLELSKKRKRTKRSKRKGATIGKCMKMNKGIGRPGKSSKPGVNALSNSANCLVEMPELESPPQSPIASEVNTLVAVTQTEMSESKVHNDIQNHIDSNDQQHSISMELHAPAGSITSNQTKVVNSDSTAIEIVIEPLATAPPDASLSSFEPLTEHGPHTEIEPQVSEAVTYYENQHPTEEINFELQPSVSMEIDTASEVSSETETEDESSQAEVEMDVLATESGSDVLATESGSTKLPQIPVCLTCGDVGFEETLVYCNKCAECALHRYCLDGPVIFTDEVIWFCEDCKEEEIETDYPDQDTSDSENDEVDSSDEECSDSVDPQPIADPIWRGSLQVFYKNDNKITRLIGHLSSLACPKVLEETRHLPNVVYASLLQRSAVWPESFRKFGTNNLSIGLYFFPQNERVERYFDQLVHEMISNDLAIRTSVQTADLLIFPSTVLPSEYKRFQSKYYLWGVFKRKQASSKINDADSSGKHASVLPDNNLFE